MGTLRALLWFCGPLHNIFTFILTCLTLYKTNVGLNGALVNKKMFVVVWVKSKFTEAP